MREILFRGKSPVTKEWVCVKQRYDDFIYDSPELIEDGDDDE